MSWLSNRERYIVDYLYINNIDIFNIPWLSRELGISVGDLSKAIGNLHRYGLIDRVSNNIYIVRFDRILDSADSDSHSRICKDVMRYLYENSVSVVVRSDMCRIKLKRGRCITLKELVRGLGKSVIDIARALNALSINGFIDRRHRDIYRVDWDRVLSYRKCFLAPEKTIVYEDPFRLIELSYRELSIITKYVENGYRYLYTSDRNLFGSRNSEVFGKWARYGIAKRVSRGVYEIDIDNAKKVVETCRNIVLASSH